MKHVTTSTHINIQHTYKATNFQLKNYMGTKLTIIFIVMPLFNIQVHRCTYTFKHTHTVSTSKFADCICILSRGHCGRNEEML